MKQVMSNTERAKAGLRTTRIAARTCARDKIDAIIRREDVRFLNARERALVQLAINVGAQNKHGVIERTRACHQHGLVPTELLEVALLAVGEIDCPKALSWINDSLD
jgi:hypothetical protein